jgi:hypothetical protein
MRKWTVAKNIGICKLPSQDFEHVNAQNESAIKMAGVQMSEVSASHVFLKDLVDMRPGLRMSCE